MKKIIILSLLLTIGLTSYSFWGFGRNNSRGMMGYNRDYNSNYTEDAKVTDYLNTLKEKYSIKENDELETGKLSETELEKLGELLMSSRAYDEEHLSFMQDRMGGAKSNDLRSAYRAMGYNYLNGYGMMGYGGYNQNKGGGFFGRMGACFGRGRGERAYYDDSAIDILERRFANGEITKDEFNEMKKVLEK